MRPSFCSPNLQSAHYNGNPAYRLVKSAFQTAISKREIVKSKFPLRHLCYYVNLPGQYCKAKELHRQKQNRQRMVEM